jgi:hypothetical protein
VGRARTKITFVLSHQTIEDLRERVKPEERSRLWSVLSFELWAEIPGVNRARRRLLLSAGADRFGLWGAYGQPHVAWGRFCSFRCLHWKAKFLIIDHLHGDHGAREIESYLLRWGNECRLIVIPERRVPE